MKPHTVTDRAFMADLSKALRRAMKDKNLKADEAADGLGVSRASFYKYLGKTDLPRLEVIERACKLWGLDLKYGGLPLDEEVFRSGKRSAAHSIPTQISLPFLEALREEDIRVLDVRPRKPNSIELRIEITFAGSRPRKSA